MLPATQRRELTELLDQLDVGFGESRDKKSAFWTMLTLSAVIAVVGVLADSTATVIGAMIIAPLSVPIMGMAVGIVLADGRLLARSAGHVFGGLLLVVLIGIGFAFLLPSSTNVLSNGQVLGRTSPGLLDLIAALATGFAGAVGMARRDVSAVLPGVAIAISLVPPLGVVGVCLGLGEFFLALGALLLFLSNLVALVLAGTLVFSASGYASEVLPGSLQRRRAYSVVTVLLLVVFVPLAINTGLTVLVSHWEQQVIAAAQEWAATVPGARVDEVTIAASTAVVHVESPTYPPDPAALTRMLSGRVPDGLRVELDVGLSQRLDAGIVGG